MAELDDLQSSLSAIREQNASLLSELSSLQQQLTASASQPTLGAPRGATCGYGETVRPGTAPLRLLQADASSAIPTSAEPRFRYRPPRTPEVASRLLAASTTKRSLRESASSPALVSPASAPHAATAALLNFLESVGLSRDDFGAHKLPRPAPVYLLKKPGPPSMIKRYAPREGTNHPPPRKPAQTFADGNRLRAEAQQTRRAAVPATSGSAAALFAQHLARAPPAVGAAAARQLRERSGRARLPPQMVVIAGVERPATAQIDRPRSPPGIRRKPLTREITRADAAERRIFATRVRGWTPLPPPRAAEGRGSGLGAAELAAAVHVAHAASMEAARAGREAKAVGSNGELLQLDGAEGAAGGTSGRGDGGGGNGGGGGGGGGGGDGGDGGPPGNAGGVGTSWDDLLLADRQAELPAGEGAAALARHRAECRTLLEVIRGWDVRGKVKLDRFRFESRLGSLEQHVRIHPTLLRSILDHCEGREVDVIDMRLFCETLALPCNVGLVDFSGELVPNALRGLRSTKELPIGSNPLGPPAQPAPWAEPYGDGSTANVNLSLRFASPEAHLKKIEEEVRARDVDRTGESSAHRAARAARLLGLGAAAGAVDGRQPTLQSPRAPPL